MGLNCGCAGDKLMNLPDVVCKAGFGQIQRLIFQRRYNDFGSLNRISDSEMALASTWISLSVAEDSTKVVISPFIGNPELGSGAKRAFGGDNSTVNGVELNVGREASQFSAILYEESSDVVNALKSFQCETLSVYFVDEFGAIGAIQLDGGGYTGVPITNFFVGDRNFGGLIDPDSNQLNFSMLPNWSDNLVRLRAEDLGYNLLYELDREFSRDFNEDFNYDFAIF